MHPLLIGVLVCVVAASVQLSRRNSAVSQPNKGKHRAMWLLLFAIPVGLLFDYLFFWFMLVVAYAAALIWVLFFGPLRPIHEWFT
jgi:uncharacterized membrane protein